MFGTKLCLGLNSSFVLSNKDQIRLLKTTGFDGFFTDWDNRTKDYRALADELGMEYQSIHAPFRNAAILWHGTGEQAEAAVEEYLRCVRECAEVKVPILVMHTYIGFEPSAGPNETGLARYRRIVEEAAKLGVRIAFENTEGEEYLAALMEAFKAYENVGFCWDTGHECCYNDKDMMALYGDRLIATHLNDNLGISDYNGTITCLDDLHLLPFDGISDWKSIVDRLNKHSYNGILTFELKRRNSPRRHDHDKYLSMTPEQYIAEAYARACRVATLKRG